ncbi:phenoloxidase-activating factor 2-like [Epargyreus clarus]|uniref:phenoloxidase-activating factor 2-like n=1 Tax=Epargyreus clarus TaxID=520877 RepID=UPI003C2E758D
MADDTTSCSYLEQCCLPPNVREASNPIKPQIKQVCRSGCGWRNPKGLGFQITGNNAHEAEFGEFPWMVAVLRKEELNRYQSINLYIGGGSLIHPRVVLTAAHILNTMRLKVRAGEWDTQTERELYPHQERLVIEVDVHDRFNKENLHYDVALLYLDRPMDLQPNVGLACIPHKRVYLDKNAECFATGWGKNQYGKSGQYQNILKKIDLQLVDHRLCEAQLRRTRLQRHFNLHPSFLCAGGEVNKDTCTGDGGSPLVCPVKFERDRYVQMGIVAWGIECGHALPGVYSAVAAFGGWIDNSVGMRGLDTRVYRY